jgi:hypothetical protein
MMHDGFISWQQFVKQPHVARLSLNEQTAQYQLYMYQFNLMRVEIVRGGGDLNYLAQEEYDSNMSTYFLLLQEDGYKIIIT